MTVIIEFPDDQGAALKTQAQAHGLTLQQWLLQLAQQQRSVVREIERYTVPATSLQDELSPQEWVRQFHDWAESHDRTTPLLTDEAISRESIYPDRI